MCKVAALALLLCSMGLPLSAQAPAEADTIRLARKADSLARLWSEATALADLSDSLARLTRLPATDTLVVGGLRLVSNRSRLPLKAAAERAWPIIDSLYGSAANGLKETPYLIQAIDPDSQRQVRRPWGLQIPWDLTTRELADLLLIYVPIPPADQAWQRWAGNTLRPSPRGRQGDFEDAYVLLVTSHYDIGQECFAGRIERCRTLLGLDDQPDPLRLFATLAERQKVARLLYVSYQQAGVRSDVIPCLEGRDDSCKAALSKLPAAQVPTPVALTIRTGIATLALRVGGRDAYSRLMADSLAPMPARLGSAAGVPVDSLVRLWHSEVVASRPKPVAIPPFAGIVGLGWGVVFGLMALRSSRWRVQ